MSFFKGFHNELEKLAVKKWLGKKVTEKSTRDLLYGLLTGSALGGLTGRLIKDKDEHWLKSVARGMAIGGGLGGVTAGIARPLVLSGMPAVAQKTPLTEYAGMATAGAVGGALVSEEEKARNAAIGGLLGALLGTRLIQK